MRAIINPNNILRIRILLDGLRSHIRHNSLDDGDAVCYDDSLRTDDSRADDLILRVFMPLYHSIRQTLSYHDRASRTLHHIRQALRHIHTIRTAYSCIPQDSQIRQIGDSDVPLFPRLMRKQRPR